MGRWSAGVGLIACVLVGCSVDVDARFEGPMGGTAAPGGQSGGDNAAASGGTMAGPISGAGGSGAGGTMATDGGTGGQEAPDAAVDAGIDGSLDEDATPDYGELTILPDSDEHVTDCTGQRDMTLCDVTTAPDRSYDVCIDEVCVSPGCGDQSCNARGPHFHIPPMFDHHALELQPGAQPVTIDLITGLHWQSCSAGKTGADCTGGTYLDLTWNDALAYCDDLSWAGHDDWYVPDPYELVSILDDDVAPDADALLRTTAFPNAKDAPLSHWTSTSTGPSDALVIASDRRTFFEITTRQSTLTTLSVFCVRRGFSVATSPAHARYDQTPLVFTDHATGLVWPSCLMRIPNATDCSDLLDKVTPQRAPERCAQLDWGGSGAWRVPTFKELQSLLIYPRDGNTWNATFDERVVTPEGLFLITDDGHAFSTDGRRVDLSGTYPYLCVRGPVTLSN